MEIKSIEELKTYVRDIHSEYSEEVISAAMNEIEKRKEQVRNQEPVDLINGFLERPDFNESKKSLKKSVCILNETRFAKNHSPISSKLSVIRV